MKVIRTSRTDPLRIDSVQPKGMTGRIGMTLCPGKIQTNARGGEWRRDLREDLRCIQNWEAVALLNLLTPAEIRDLGISEIEVETKQLGILYFHLPMEDGGIPDAKGENIWREISSFLRSRLKAGENVVVHCKGGLGRTGTMAARLLVETGSDSKAAVRAVRKARPGAIENALQENYIHKLTLPQKEGVLAALTSRLSQPQTMEQVRNRFLGCLLGGAVMILALADGASLQQALKAGMECLAPCDGYEETLEALNLAVDLSKSDVASDQAMSRLGRGWVAEEALAIGVYCALKARCFREDVLMAVNHDGDSDSTGAIAGNLLGAMFGVEAIPQAWLEDLELRGVIEELAADLFEMKSWPLYLQGGGSDLKKIRDAWAYTEKKYPGW